MSSPVFVVWYIDSDGEVAYSFIEADNSMSASRICRESYDVWSVFRVARVVWDWNSAGEV